MRSLSKEIKTDLSAARALQKALSRFQNAVGELVLAAEACSVLLQANAPCFADDEDPLLQAFSSEMQSVQQSALDNLGSLAAARGALDWSLQAGLLERSAKEGGFCKPQVGAAHATYQKVKRDGTARMVLSVAGFLSAVGDQMKRSGAAIQDVDGGENRIAEEPRDGMFATIDFSRDLPKQPDKSESRDQGNCAGAEKRCEISQTFRQGLESLASKEEQTEAATSMKEDVLKYSTTEFVEEKTVPVSQNQDTLKPAESGPRLQFQPLLASGASEFQIGSAFDN